MVFVDYEMCDSLSPLSLFLSWCTYLCKAIQLIVLIRAVKVGHYLKLVKISVTIQVSCAFSLCLKNSSTLLNHWFCHHLLDFENALFDERECSVCKFGVLAVEYCFFKAIKKTRNVFLIKSQVHLAWLYNLEVIPQLLCIMNTLWC